MIHDLIVQYFLCPPKTPLSSVLVRGTGFEPAWACARYHLKVVRLPVSPPARYINYYTSQPFFQSKNKKDP